MKLRCRIGAFCFLLFQKLDSVLSLNAARVESYWPLAFGYKLMAEKWGRENQVVGIASC